MNDNAIILDQVWKSYPLRRDTPGFKEFLLNLWKFQKNNNHVFWALKNITLTVKKGECLGIIGRNGAGKSTILSLLLGTTFPTRGGVQASSKKTPLLELGAGFHGDLTGIENTLLNGVLLGLTIKEVSKRMESIISFAELGEFIDMPTRTYSSGMYMRLAFSIAIHTDPEILLIDEILSVGDESFQRKSREALMKLIHSGVTTVFASHDLNVVKDMCDKVIWLDHGEIKEYGDPQKVVSDYLQFL